MEFFGMLCWVIYAPLPLDNLFYACVTRLMLWKRLFQICMCWPFRILHLNGKKKKKTHCKRWLCYLLREKILRYILFFFSFFPPSGSVIKKPRVGTPILRLAGKYPAKITYKYVGNFKNMMCAERIIKTRISEAARERQSKQTPLRVCWWGLLFDETGHQWLLHFWAWMSHWLSRKRTVNISYPNDTEHSSVEASAPLE